MIQDTWPKQKRQSKTIAQIKVLMQEYALDKFPCAWKRQQIAEATGLTSRGVQIWCVLT